MSRWRRKSATALKLDHIAMEIGAQLRESIRQNRRVGYKIIEELKDVMQADLSPVGADERLTSLQALFREFARTLQERSEHYMKLAVHEARKLPYHN